MTKNLYTTIVLGIATLAIVVAGAAYLKPQTFSGQFYNNNPKTFDDIVTFNVRDSASSAATGVIGKTFATGSQISCWQNTIGATVYVRNSVFSFPIASSTFRAFEFATTTSPTSLLSLYSLTALSEAINGANTFLMNGTTYATSTTATTTNSAVELKAGRSNGTITVANNAYFCNLLQAVDAAGCAGAGKCEAATSTRRGSNPSWRADLLK